MAAGGPGSLQISPLDPWAPTCCSQRSRRPSVTTATCVDCDDELTSILPLQEKLSSFYPVVFAIEVLVGLLALSKLTVLR